MGGPAGRVPRLQPDSVVPGYPAVRHVVRGHPLHHGPGDLLRQDYLAQLPLSQCLAIKHQNRISLDSILSHSWFNQQTETLIKVSTSSSSLMSISPATSSSSESSSSMITDSPITSSHPLIAMTVK